MAAVRRHTTVEKSVRSRLTPCSRMGRNAYMALLALAALPPWRTASAQALSTADTSSLQLSAVYDAVARGNPRAAAARGLADAKATLVPGARRLPDPQLQLGFMNYRLPQLAPMQALGMTQLQLMQMVPVAGKLGIAGRIASTRAAAETESAHAVSWMVRSEGAMAFYELYQTDVSLGVARETLRLLLDLQRISEAMYRVGESQQADVLRAQVEVAKMTEDTLRMVAMRTSAAARLNALANLGAGEPVGMPKLPTFPAEVPSLASLISDAENARPMVRAGERALDAALAGEELARREIWPDLQVGIQYGQRGGEMGTERMGSLMVGASLPIFARDRQYKMRDEAAAMRQMAEADLAAMRADTRSRVAEVHADLIRARRLAALYRGTILPQAQAAVTSALAAYRVGRVNFMTLLDNQMAVNRFRQELAALEAEEGQDWAELEMLLGRELLSANHSARDADASGAIR